ncbi:hypothetical protein ACHAQH_003341 [Verticillium albo-atrum]
MATFDSSKAYAEQEEIYFDDGREKELQHYVHSRPNIEQLRNSPRDVLAAIDEFGRQQKYLMNIGSEKGAIVTDLIEDLKPKTMVELGGYVGYSAILFGDALRRSGGQRFICIEKSPEFAAVARSLIELAGLSAIVEIHVGSAGPTIERLHSEGVLESIDLLFLDHIKPAYLPDLQTCEELNLIRQGSVLAADNVIKPGNPPYLEYVRSTVEDKRKTVASTGVYTSTEGSSPRGDPSLIYQSDLIHSFEPTGIPDGVEITRCIGRESSK